MHLSIQYDLRFHFRGLNPPTCGMECIVGSASIIGAAGANRAKEGEGATLCQPYRERYTNYCKPQFI